jgi:putative membrane protein
MTAPNSVTRYQKSLLAIFVVLWVALAIKPYYRQDWLLENILVAILVPSGLLIVRYFRLSNLSYTLITVFLILHITGAHYTYEKVPFGYTISNWFGAERNHYDRIVHFSFGFLLAYPIREMFLRIASVRGMWGYVLPLDVTLSCSAIFEIFEWLVAAVVNPQAGLAYLGSQGDIWDAQKDMGLAGLGALITMIIIALVNWRYDDQFGAEFRDSLRIKSHMPLGEVRLRELIKARKERLRGNR